MPFPILNAHLAQALAERDYAEPTPVQLAVLEPAAEGKDLLVSAQTGSGKTVAYGLAIAETLLAGAERLPPRSPPLALIVAPTRELAMQVHAELTWLYAKVGARVVSCVGGMDVRREQRALSDGAHIIVGTPGRLRDHLERGRIDTSEMRAVVLDEADEMLDLGFREDLEFILDTTPPERRTLLFSATIPREIAALAKSYQRDAFRIEATNKGEAHGDIEYRAVRCAPNDIEHAVVNVLRYFEARAAMVFCATRDAVRHLHASLVERGFAAVALSGELSQNERSHALQAVRDGRARVCVATDVAARGIDVPDLALVIHAELPNNRDTLLHRSGRTGRAGRKGTCVLIVPHTRRRKAEQLLMGSRLDVVWSGAPTVEEIQALDQERLLADPILAEEATEEDLVLGRALLEKQSAEQIAAALIRLQRSRMPAPEELDAAPSSAPTPLAPRRGGGDGVWFRMNVGRNNNADPRWLLPIICRMGQVTKPDVGSIRILDRETRFEIAPSAAARFAAALLESRDPKIRIEPAGAEGAPPPRERKPYRPKEGYDPAKQSYPPREAGAAPAPKKKFKKAKAG
ncbi:DEAD/DEAH box helicase [Oleomonas cavernae]|uniref:DEAD/DEAH box helicase n=1 Tax=Oleomonas cavernae TaxID=2320859 RepID=A0A418WIQ7_9PROT|nr:DEAD/DEAH box helicase [Oleomonas cavernae]RJF89875.1 DEAD/DEAH box helicase [Oleomonas cavernae]